jgi:hypothetical protein
MAVLCILKKVNKMKSATEKEKRVSVYPTYACHWSQLKGALMALKSKEKNLPTNFATELNSAGINGPIVNVKDRWLYLHRSSKANVYDERRPECFEHNMIKLKILLNKNEREQELEQINVGNKNPCEAE